MRARVSNLEAFRSWRDDEAYKNGWVDAPETVEDLVARLCDHEPSEAMLAGTAFHYALEHAQVGVEYSTLEAQGFTFLLPDAELELPLIREVRAEKDYSGLIVSGKLDCLEGRRVDDHKTTGRVDLERYLAGYSWRFYLDIFGADTFRWNVFPIREVTHRVYQVEAPQRLEQRRYPGLHADCARLAAEFREFAAAYLPADFDALALEAEAA